MVHDRGRVMIGGERARLKIGDQDQKNKKSLHFIFCFYADIYIAFF